MHLQTEILATETTVSGLEVAGKGHRARVVTPAHKRMQTLPLQTLAATGMVRTRPPLQEAMLHPLPTQLVATLGRPQAQRLSQQQTVLGVKVSALVLQP
jgi:hypothetical protein